MKEIKKQRTNIFQLNIPFVIFQSDPFAHDLLSMQLNTGECEKLSLKNHWIFIGVHIYAWEILAAPLYFD